MRWCLVALVLLSVITAGAENRRVAPQFDIRTAFYCPADGWRLADAVVRLRIEETKPLGSRIAELGGLSVQHTATIISALKTHAVRGPTRQIMTVMQAGSTSERPYAKGEEFIAFLHWYPESGLFGQAFGPGSFYPIRQGKVEWCESSREVPWRSETITVEDFVARLLALSK